MKNKKQVKRSLVRLLMRFELAHGTYVNMGMYKPEEHQEIGNNYIDLRSQLLDQLRKIR